MSLKDNLSGVTVNGIPAVLEVEGPRPAEIPAEPAEVETLKAADHPIVKWLKGLW